MKWNTGLSKYVLCCVPNQVTIENTNEIRNQNASLQEVRDDKKRSAIGTEKPSLFLSKRLLVTILLFLTNVNIIFIRYNVNVAVIEMTSSKSIVTDGNLTAKQAPEFHWDTKTNGLVLSIFFYGNLLAFLSGFIISKIGGSTSMAISMMICGITTFLQPIALGYSFYLFLFCRFVTGMLGGFVSASVIEVCSNWMPRSERGTLMSFCLNGLYVATAFMHPICGFIISELGWQMVFYSTGAVGSLLSLVCLVLVRNHPSEDKWISKKELSYILQETNTSHNKRHTTQPYKLVIKSVPIWMLCMVNILCGWIVSVVLTSLPLFIKDSTGRSTQEVAFISSLPCFLGILVSTLGGPLMDCWKNRSNITLTKMHKIVIGTAYSTQLILFVALTFVRDLIATIIIFILISLFLPLMSLVLQLICINLAPNHTGLIAGYTTFWYASSPIAAQTVAGFMTTNHTINEWNSYFFLTAGIILFGTILFVLYGSSEPQSWSLPHNFENQSNVSDAKQNSQLVILISPSGSSINYNVQS